MIKVIECSGSLIKHVFYSLRVIKRPDEAITGYYAPVYGVHRVCICLCVCLCVCLRVWLCVRVCACLRMHECVSLCVHENERATTTTGRRATTQEEMARRNCGDNLVKLLEGSGGHGRFPSGETGAEAERVCLCYLGSNTVRCVLHPYPLPSERCLNDPDTITRTVKNLPPLSKYSICP